MQSSAYQLKQEHRHLCRCKEEETEVVSFLPSCSIDLDKRVSHRDLPASSSEIDRAYRGAESRPLVPSSSIRQTDVLTRDGMVCTYRGDSDTTGGGLEGSSEDGVHLVYSFCVLLFFGFKERGEKEMTRKEERRAEEVGVVF